MVFNSFFEDKRIYVSGALFVSAAASGSAQVPIMLVAQTFPPQESKFQS
jgi:hypothetical protein